MYHIFSIPYSLGGHLGCFQFLAIMKKAATNIIECPCGMTEHPVIRTYAPEWYSWVLG